MLTLESLDQSIKSKAPDKVIELFDSKSEKERKVVAERAKDWFSLCQAYKTADDWRVGPGNQFLNEFPRNVRTAVDLIDKHKKNEIDLPKEVKDSSYLEVCRIALLASNNLTTLRKFRGGGIPELQYAQAILLDRKPKFLDRWLLFALDNERYDFWQLLRVFEGKGDITCDTTPAYFHGMILTLAVDDRTLKSALDNEDIQSKLWLLLEDVEAVKRMTFPLVQPNMRSDFAFDDWQRQALHSRRLVESSKKWQLALVEKAKSDQQFQTQLVDKVLTALTRLSTDSENKSVPSYYGFKSSISWLTTVINELDTTEENQSALISRYVGLLATRDWEALVWVINQLNSFPTEKLPVSDLCTNIGGVFTNKRKDPAMEALKLLQNLRQSLEKNGDESYHQEIDLAVLEALEHKSTQVRKKSLSLLKKWKSVSNRQVAEELEQKIEEDILAGLEREQAVKLLEEFSSLKTSPQDEHLTEPIQEDDKEEKEDLLKRVDELDQSLALIARIPEALEVLEGKSENLPALQLTELSIPRLSKENELKPIDNLDDLNYLLLQVLEGKNTLDQLELAYDGISRLCDQRPEDFERRFSQLLKKAEELTGSEWNYFLPFKGAGVNFDIAGIVKAWQSEKKGLELLQAKEVAKNLLERAGSFIDFAIPINKVTLLSFLSDRARFVAKNATEKESLPLLATPTHKGGWLDPLALPERLKVYRMRGKKPDSLDFIQALIRLAPDNREQAKLLHDDIKFDAKYKADEMDDALQYALGAELAFEVKSAGLSTSFMNMFSKDNSSRIENASYWIAAARARAPYKDDPILASRFKDKCGPDAAIAAKYQEDFSDFSKQKDMSFIWDDRAKIAHILKVEPTPPQQRSTSFPTILFHYDLWLEGPFANIWPLNRESFFAYETRRMALYVDSTAHYLEDKSWEVFFDPDISTDNNGSYAIAIALTAKLQEVNRLALDALIASVDDCKIDGTKFGTILAALHKTGKATISRWIKSLKELSQASPCHLLFTIKALESWIANLGEPDQKAPANLIELLYELCSKTNSGIELESARHYLEVLPGKGKKAKLAKLLLALPAQKSRGFLHQCALIDISNRVARVERWQSMSKQYLKECRAKSEG